MTNHEIATISVHELKKRYDANPNLCLIDVRELHEWQSMRIPRAVHIPKNELTAHINEIVPDHRSPVYLHCLGGVRSLYAANCLLEMGYKEVYSIDGGIADWDMQGYPVEKF